MNSVRTSFNSFSHLGTVAVFKLRKGKERLHLSQNSFLTTPPSPGSTLNLQTLISGSSCMEKSVGVQPFLARCPEMGEEAAPV